MKITKYYFRNIRVFLKLLKLDFINSFKEKKIFICILSIFLPVALSIGISSIFYGSDIEMIKRAYPVHNQTYKNSIESLRYNATILLMLFMFSFSFFMLFLKTIVVFYEKQHIQKNRTLYLYAHKKYFSLSKIISDLLNTVVILGLMSASIFIVIYLKKYRFKLPGALSVWNIFCFVVPNAIFPFVKSLINFLFTYLTIIIFVRFLIYRIKNKKIKFLILSSILLFFSFAPGFFVFYILQTNPKTKIFFHYGYFYQQLNSLWSDLFYFIPVLNFGAPVYNFLLASHYDYFFLIPISYQVVIIIILSIRFSKVHKKYLLGN